MPIPPACRRVAAHCCATRCSPGSATAIVDGTFAPGEQLRDLELAGWLGVSRTPVREALLRLAEAGLVAAEPGRSTDGRRRSTLRAVRDARDVVAAMHELAVREAVAAAHRGRPRRDARRPTGGSAAALPAGDVEAALARRRRAARRAGAGRRQPGRRRACSTSSRPCYAGPSGAASPRWPAAARSARHDRPDPALRRRGDADARRRRRLRHLALARHRPTPDQEH